MLGSTKLGILERVKRAVMRARNSKHRHSMGGEGREEGMGWGWGCHFQSICFQYTCSGSTKMLPILDSLSSLANILWPMEIFTPLLYKNS